MKHIYEKIENVFEANNSMGSTTYVNMYGYFDKAGKFIYDVNKEEYRISIYVEGTVSDNPGDFATWSIDDIDIAKFDKRQDGEYYAMGDTLTSGQIAAIKAEFQNQYDQGTFEDMWEGGDE